MEPFSCTVMYLVLLFTENYVESCILSLSCFSVNWQLQMLIRELHGGVFLLACDYFGRMFDHLFPAYAFFCLL